MKLICPEQKESPETLARLLNMLEDLATTDKLSEAHYYKGVVIVAGRYAGIGHLKEAGRIVRDRLPSAYTMSDMITQMLDDREFHVAVVDLANEFLRSKEVAVLLGELRPTQPMAKA